MLEYKSAIALAEKAIASMSPLPDGDTLILLLEHTTEHPFGWVFFYTSRLYNETGDFKYALGGNSPLIVDRHTGTVVPTGTARPIQDYIEEYAARSNSRLQP